MAEISLPCGPVPLPEGSIVPDEEVQALQTALELAAATMTQRPGSAIVHELHRTAAAKYRDALAARGLAMPE
ncbi:MAG TPA: hypothetical protein DEB30_05340 [Candidatus Peribacter riflensis]|uniref:Uncharacterized protein n=1 Tax=Candidatus Peribacter riflensis TaxID=1735162 RepID=A0A0S1SA61_9BACT|nr:MAG: hypothetical protein PeribacterA2_0127 [Candidatus Peribacter riflensis]OGJ76702.1 MAG: hypothetical protein A2398_03685 [Candidatus Peribacteria bacterium RIFOXYB1_FULL_57_12]OGJ82057.1 MAG: hypothetical protein A2412_05105 [Candidatus Peribacteria bacterium RIFOXYC1_FULL_58_8]ALM10624.1 MAG: hypothetical protein PeribacterB2_0127 [Candidatus Peribacter riflensis]ALM11726.1 MAG: hypothetical protein PeribacterC2_0126 [Candidatus Peribacter riflensis]